MSDREPTEAEIHQTEPEFYMPAEVPVRVEGPIRAQVLPRQGWAIRTIELSVTPTKLVGREPRRGRVLLVASALSWVGNVETQAKANVGFRVPASIPVEFSHTEEIWGVADTGTATISVSEEFWTE